MTSVVSLEVATSDLFLFKVPSPNEKFQLKNRNSFGQGPKSALVSNIAFVKNSRVHQRARRIISSWKSDAMKDIC